MSSLMRSVEEVVTDEVSGGGRQRIGPWTRSSQMRSVWEVVTDMVRGGGRQR